LCLLATITFEVVTFRAYAPFPALLQFVNLILEVMFCEGLQHRLRFRLDHLSGVKMAFQLNFQPGKQKKVAGVQVRRVGWLRDDSHVVLVKNSMVRRKCKLVRCRDATVISFVAKFRGEIFAHFHAVTVKRHSSMQN
jgi:hypothetical protein